MHKGLCGANVVRKPARVQRLFDAQNQRVGRLAETLSKLLIGKHKLTYRPNIENSDVCVVVNAEKIQFTGSTQLRKVYRSHSGKPGTLKIIPADQLLQSKPEEILRRAVKGMLPNNNSRNKRLENLLIYSGPTHPFGKEFGESDTNSEVSNVKHRFAYIQSYPSHKFLPYLPIDQSRYKRLFKKFKIMRESKRRKKTDVEFKKVEQ